MIFSQGRRTPRLEVRERPRRVRLHIGCAVTNQCDERREEAVEPFQRGCVTAGGAGDRGDGKGADALP